MVRIPVVPNGTASGVRCGEGRMVYGSRLGDPGTFCPSIDWVYNGNDSSTSQWQWDGDSNALWIPPGGVTATISIDSGHYELNGDWRGGWVRPAVHVAYPG